MERGGQYGRLRLFEGGDNYVLWLNVSMIVL